MYHRKHPVCYVVVKITYVKVKYRNIFWYCISFFLLVFEEFEDTKRVIRILISKNRQHNGQKVQKDKQRSTKHTHKTKDQVTRTPLKTGCELRRP